MAAGAAACLYCRGILNDSRPPHPMRRAAAVACGRHRRLDRAAGGESGAGRHPWAHHSVVHQSESIGHARVRLPDRLPRGTLPVRAAASVDWDGAGRRQYRAGNQARSRLALRPRRDSTPGGSSSVRVDVGVARSDRGRARFPPGSCRGNGCRCGSCSRSASSNGSAQQRCCWRPPWSAGGRGCGFASH